MLEIAERDVAVAVSDATPANAVAINALVADGRAGYHSYVEGLDGEWAEQIRCHINSREQVEACEHRICETQSEPERLLYLVAKIGEVVVGTLHAEKRPAEHPDEQELIRMFVDPSWQRRGVASSLMLGYMGWAMRDPNLPMMLYMTQGNVAGKKFYDRWGYELRKGSERTFDDGIPTIILDRTKDVRPLQET